MTRLTLVRGGATPERVLAPSTPLARRAGLTPVAVPSDMWVAPALLEQLAPEPPRLRLLRGAA